MTKLTALERDIVAEIGRQLHGWKRTAKVGWAVEELNRRARRLDSRAVLGGTRQEYYEEAMGIALTALALVRDVWSEQVPEGETA